MKDKYKHLLNFTANIISLAVEAWMFGWVWYILYIPMLDKANAFFNRGNWAVIGMYILFVFFFTKIFGGYRIGYMRISDIILSQILAVVLAMIVGYFEIWLVATDYLPTQPLLLLTVPATYIYRSVGCTGAKGIYASVSAASDACYLWKLFAG